MDGVDGGWGQVGTAECVAVMYDLVLCSGGCHTRGSLIRMTATPGQMVHTRPPSGRCVAGQGGPQDRDPGPPLSRIYPPQLSAQPGPFGPCTTKAHSLFHVRLLLKNLKLFWKKGQTSR